MMSCGHPLKTFRAFQAAHLWSQSDVIPHYLQEKQGGCDLPGAGSDTWDALPTTGFKPLLPIWALDFDLTGVCCSTLGNRTNKQLFQGQAKKPGRELLSRDWMLMGTPHKAWRQLWKMRNLVKHIVLTQRNQREAAVSKAKYPGMHSGSVQLEKPSWEQEEAAGGKAGTFRFTI